MNFMKSSLFFVTCLFVIWSANARSFVETDRNEWEAFKEKHMKKYDEVEDESRFKIFIENKDMIDRHNHMVETQNAFNHTLKMNEFGDLTHEEFMQLKGCVFVSTHESINASTFNPPMNFQIPERVDWRDRGFVTPVKNQRGCGSCWAFAATGALEGQHFKKTGRLISLSEQNLVDCSRSHGNKGCQGGSMDRAFQHIKDNGGIDTEESYPYEARDAPCRFKKEKVGATVTGFTRIPSGNVDLMMKAVASVGPISVAINARKSFQFYKTGIYDEPQCSSTNLSHGVLVVGYGTENGVDYWLIKNSWDEDWGEKGYGKIKRDNNLCGVCTAASYPTV